MLKPLTSWMSGDTEKSPPMLKRKGVMICKSPRLSLFTSSSQGRPFTLRAAHAASTRLTISGKRAGRLKYCITSDTRGRPGAIGPEIRGGRGSVMTAGGGLWRAMQTRSCNDTNEREWLRGRDQLLSKSHNGLGTKEKPMTKKTAGCRQDNCGNEPQPSDVPSRGEQDEMGRKETNNGAFFMYARKTQGLGKARDSPVIAS